MSARPNRQRRSGLLAAILCNIAAVGEHCLTNRHEYSEGEIRAISDALATARAQAEEAIGRKLGDRLGGVA